MLDRAALTWLHLARECDARDDVGFAAAADAEDGLLFDGARAALEAALADIARFDSPPPPPKRVATAGAITREQLAAALIAELAEAEALSLIGFGTFSRRARKARVGRNPRSGERIEIPGRQVLSFKPATALKMALGGAPLEVSRRRDALSRRVALQHGLAPDRAAQRVRVALQAVVDDLCAGERVSLPGLGTLAAARRQARQGRNPRTGERIEIPASATVSFTPAK